MQLRLPSQKWKFSEFRQYIIENAEDVFSGPRKRWLKMYYIYINDEALSDLKRKLEPIEQGDLLKFQLSYKESASQRSKEEPYYMEMVEPGLARFFTSSTKEGYEKTLRRRISRTRGLSDMWMRPETFEKVKNFIVNEYGAKIKGFLSLSSIDDDDKARIRPHVKRRIHYRGDDGIESLSELKTWYGVSPISIDFKIKRNLFQITNEGLFTLKTPNETTFEIVDRVLELIREEQIKQKETALGLKFETRNNIVTLESAKIILPTTELLTTSTNVLVNNFQGFVFTDICSTEGSVDFSATVIDRYKGSVFDLSMSERDIVLIPRYKATYESFLNFYRNVVEVFDRHATFQPF